MTHRFHDLLRWLMFLWVRVEVFPRENPPFEIDPGKPTLYVLADRGLGDLLVLSQICKQLELPDPGQAISLPSMASYHAVYSIASPSPLFDWLRQRKKESPLLQDLLQVVRADRDITLQVIPVSVYWGRPLAKQRHWLQVLFADTWALAGRTRKFITMLLNGRSTRLLFSQPIDFQILARDSEYSAEQVHASLIDQLTRQREATFGPQITSRNNLITQVLHTPRVQNAIEQATRDKSISLRKAQAKARRYSQEIFANCTQPTIEFMLRLLRFFWGRYYSSIETYNVDRLKQTALTHQLVYVPCHRSHVDYLLLSYIIYNENLAIPYIAAGDNLNLPIIGRILRGGGAFFIRRSFKDSPLYGAVMRAYVDKLIAQGVPLEYFIEGGRSRTGRMLKPKLGMLDMTVEAYIKSQTRPLAFVPVYIGYEKILEGKSYLGELYGEKKQSESLFSTVTAIFRLKGHFGKVTASFGNPVVISSLLDKHKADWAERADEIAQKPDWYRNTVSSLAQQIMFEINRACVINPVNLIATILLATPRQSIDKQELIEQGAFLERLIESVPDVISLQISTSVDDAQIMRIAEQKLLHIRSHPLGDIVYLKPENSVYMGYYRNNSLHALIIPALIACCFVNNRQMSVSKLLQVVRVLYPFLQSELHLEWNDREMKSLINKYLSNLVKEGVLIKTKTTIRRPDRTDRSFLFLNRLAQVVQPILERYYMTFVVLWESAEAPMQEGDLEQRCHLLAQKISMIYGINAPDFFDRLLFRNFLETMLTLGYLKHNETQALVFTEAFNVVNLDIRSLLSIEVRSTILALIRH